MVYFTQNVQLYTQTIQLQIVLQIPGGNNMVMAVTIWQWQ